MNEQVNFLGAVFSYYTNRSKPLNTPLISNIEISARCNLNCTFCVRNYVKDNSIMTDETFFNIVNKENRRYLYNPQLFGHGEPLLNPKIVEYVKAVRSYSRLVGFTTNGLLLNSELSKKLLENGLTNICFSFEGVDKNIYEKLRCGSNFEKVAVNIKEFCQLRTEGGFNCETKIAIIDLKETHPYLERFKNQWKNIVDEVLVMPHRDWGEILQSNKANSKKCFFAWLSFSILYNGDVVPCCMFEGIRKLKLGNINEESIMDIWKGVPYQNLRQSMVNNKAPSLCRVCDLTFKNRLFNLF